MTATPGPILLTGTNGQVGGQILPLLAQFGDVVAPDRSELDLTDASAVRAFVQKVRPRWIVNPAAYTAVDKAEKEPETAFAVNAEAPRALAEEAVKLGAPVLHFSTDYVFAGGGTQPWVETDTTGPLSVYGASKLAGEQALMASGAAHLIFRTSWVYGAVGNNFLRTILRLAREREEMKIVADQHGAPTWSRNLAHLVAHTIRLTEERAQQHRVDIIEAIQPSCGIYHACDEGFTTWFGFAEELLRLGRLAEPAQHFANLIPITTAEYPTPATRPSNSRMSGEKLKRQLGFTMPAWQASAAAVMAEIYAPR